MSQPSFEFSRLLDALAAGDPDASERLFPLIYDELHRLAEQCMADERKNHTLQPTALIHEAFLRLAKSSDDAQPAYADKTHFMATAAVVMRRILVNHAVRRNAAKRGGGSPALSLDDVGGLFEDRALDLVALDGALEALEALDKRQHRIVELRFFGGFTVAQCAELLSVSERTVAGEWAHARAWLRTELENQE